MRRLLVSCVLLAVGASTVRLHGHAQSGENSPSFEVASIKERTTPAAGGSQGGPDRFNRTNASLRELIRDAYQLQLYEIVGGPDWVGSLRFDVAAKASSIPSAEQMRRMVQQLLAQRFSLRAHTETRELPMYRLHLARSDGRLGPQLTRTTVDCAAIKAERNRKQEPAPRPNGPNDQPICTSFMRGRPTSSGLTLRFQSSGISTEEFAAWLSPYVGRKIVDRTGLAGDFDLDLSFSPFPPSPSAPPPDEAVSTFTALQEQLGLKLESTKGPVDVLVIDHVEKPTPD